MLRSLLVLTVVALVPSLAPAQARLDDAAKIDADLLRAVRETHIPGVVAMVADANKVLYSGAFGAQDVERAVPMSTSSIFRIASMTKPVTSVAVMMLVEAGKLSLDDPAGKYLPEFQHSEVFETFNELDKTYTSRPVKTPVTIRHLLTHTSGLGYGFDSRILARLLGGDPTASATKYPLLFDPGTKWTYGESTRVLGRIVEKVSGEPLEKFFRERIFEPLGMQDTFYTVPADKRGRVVTVHRSTQWGALVEVPNPDVITSPMNGDGGLSSTADDYVKFMQMVLNRGRAPNGKRLLSEKSIALMGSNQIGPLHVPLQLTTDRTLSEPFPLSTGHDTFGFGFEITGDHKNPAMRLPGSMSWAGIYNTEFWIDPKRGICAVLLMQYLPFYDNAAIETLQKFEGDVYTGLSK